MGSRRKDSEPILFRGSKTALQRYLMNLLEVSILVVFLFLATVVFVRVLNYILPFVIGFLIAVSLLPLERWMERRKLPRPFAIVVSMVVVLGGLFAITAFLIVQAAQEVASLSQAAPHYFTYWKEWAEREVQLGTTVYAHLPPKMVTALQSTALSSVDSARHFALSLFSTLVSGMAGLPDTVFVIVISVIAAYFFMAEQTRLQAGLRRLLPPGWEPKLETVASDMGKAFAGLLRAQLVLIAVTSVIGVVGLLVMRMPYAVILGMAIGLTGWVPIVGSGLITLPWAIAAFAMGNWVLAVKVLLLQAIASLVRHTIEPKILASNMGLGTFATLFGMYVGLTSIGFLGLLLGPILLIGMQSLLRARIFMDFLPDAPASGTAEPIGEGAPPPGGRPKDEPTRFDDL